MIIGLFREDGVLLLKEHLELKSCVKIDGLRIGLNDVLPQALLRFNCRALLCQRKNQNQKLYIKIFDHYDEYDFDLSEKVESITAANCNFGEVDEQGYRAVKYIMYKDGSEYVRKQKVKLKDPSILLTDDSNECQ